MREIEKHNPQFTGVLPRSLGGFRRSILKTLLTQFWWT
jgi:hypothetical protein